MGKLDTVLSTIAGTLIGFGAIIALALAGIVLFGEPVTASTPSVTYEARSACYGMVTVKDVPNGQPVALLFDACDGTFKWVRMPMAPEQGV